MGLTCVPDCFPILCPLLPQEDCDLENVWLMGGLSVLTSVPGGPPMVCLLCASKGLHEVSAPNSAVLASYVSSSHPSRPRLPLSQSSSPAQPRLTLPVISLLLVGLLPSVL